MTPSPFTHMAQALTALHIDATQPAWSADAVPAKDLSRTERIRQLLKAAQRPVTAAEITWDMADHFPNFGSHLVWLLLKYDMQKGRVILEDGKYRWSEEYDTDEATAIRAAIKLLKANGYRVTQPKEHA